ncbi:hypothetical protein D9M73_260090 [compost metagenome]
MFEGVGQAGESGRLVAGADPVPELGDHHRRAMVFADHHLEAVVEGEFVGRLGFCRQRDERQAEAAEQQAGAAACGNLHGRLNLKECPNGLRRRRAAS